MTTWTQAAAEDIKYCSKGGRPVRVYVITGASGNTGGTITVEGFSRVLHASACAQLADGTPIACATGVVPNSNQVKVTYTDPTAAHTVRVEITQG